MSFLLFPGRHLVNTKFQESYLQSVLGREPIRIEGLVAGQSVPPTPVKTVIFAITSANQENSRFNPIPFFVRAIGVDRFARSLRDSAPFSYRIFGVPHYRTNSQFAAFTLKEILEQSDRSLQLTPDNCLVLCSTPEVIALYQQLGFSVAPAELTLAADRRVTPIDVVRAIGDAHQAWRSHPIVAANLATATQELFEDFPEIPTRIAQIYRDPLLTQEGDLTQTRDYNPYARAMGGMAKIKYADIRAAIKPGRIVDEGCADGALLAEISRDFRDSDLFGVDLSAEFAHRFRERQRAGDFGGVYVHFYHRNLIERIFDPGSIDTTICNSTLHELWSYAGQEKTVRSYLHEKLQQLRPGGRLVIRDVIGPENGEQKILLACSTKDGAALSPDWREQGRGRNREWLATLSTHARFLVFAEDYLTHRGTPAIRSDILPHKGREVFRVDFKTAVEFLSKKDYIDNWLSEMHEEFCFWGFSRWKTVLREVGFEVLENPNDPDSGSRVFANPWIVENRYKNCSELLDADGKPIPYPPTNMVLVAERPY